MDTINTLRITLPENWGDIKLGQYIEFSLTDFNELTSFQKMTRVLSILTDIDEDSIMKLNVPQISELISELDWMYEKETPKLRKVIEIDGIKYGSIRKYQNIKVGEFIDLETYMENYVPNLHKVLAILYRPITSYIDDENYTIEDYDSDTAETRADLFYAKFTARDAISTSVFFWNFAEMYLANLTDYLQMEAMEMEKTLTNISE